MNKVEMRDPADLRLHPLQKNLPEPDKNSPEWVSFVDAQSAAGPDGMPPIFGTANGQIMDGGRRWRAAKQLGWDEVPYIVRPEEDAAALIVESLLGQRNLLRGAKVYLALGLIKEFVQSAEHRRIHNIKIGRKTLEKIISPIQLAKPGRPTEPNSIRTLAERFGCSDELVRQVIELRAKLDASPELKTEWEPKILDSQKPVGIGAALAGIGGAGADQHGRNDGVAQSQLEFWNAPFFGLAHAAPAWKKLDDDARAGVLADFRKAAKKLPTDLRDGMKEILEELE